MRPTALLLLVLASASSAATVFRQQVVTDPGMNNQPALTVLVPEGWTVEGGITRPANQLFMNPVLLDMKVKAPDGRQIRFYPNFQFEYSNQVQQQPLTPTNSGRFYYPLPRSPGAWIADLVKRFPDPKVQNAQVVSEKQDPTATAKLRQQNAAIFQMVQQGRAYEMGGGPRMDFDTQATWVTLRYREDGRDLEETINMGWQAMTMSWNGAPVSGQWTISSMVSLRGAPGSTYADDPVLHAVMKSTQPNPTWLGRMQQYWAEISRIQAKGSNDRRQQSFDAHQKRMKTLGEINDIYHQGWKDRSASGDRIQAMRVNSIHEVTPYRTSGGTSVTLPSFYDHVYSDGQGRFILGNDANYNPNTDAAINQVQWNRAQPGNQ